MYIIGGLITWLIILLVAWHDHEQKPPRTIGMDDMWDIILIGGCMGGILSMIWPITWLTVGMILLTRYIYKGYKAL